MLRFLKEEEFILDLGNWQTQLRKGMLDIVILNMLRNGQCHGYDMVRRLKLIDGLKIREGNIYPVLARLETDGLVVSHIEPSNDGPPRRCFTLTGQGMEVLRVMNAHWEQMIESIERIRKGKDL